MADKFEQGAACTFALIMPNVLSSPSECVFGLLSNIHLCEHRFFEWHEHLKGARVSVYDVQS